MSETLSCTGPARFAAALATAALACLLGACADTHWERAVYDGLRRAPSAATRPNDPAMPPSPSLPDYSRYEQERQNLRSAPTAPAPAASAGASARL